MAEIAQIATANAYVAVHTAEGHDKPEGFPMPWKSEEELASEVAPDERARLLAIIEERAASAIAHE